VVFLVVGGLHIAQVIKVKYFQGGGGSKLRLSWQQEGDKKEVVAPDFLFH
jgi:hypothetical protein